MTWTPLYRTAAQRKRRCGERDDLGRNWSVLRSSGAAARRGPERLDLGERHRPPRPIWLARLREEHQRPRREHSRQEEPDSPERLGRLVGRDQNQFISRE